VPTRQDPSFQPFLHHEHTLMCATVLRKGVAAGGSGTHLARPEHLVGDNISEGAASAQLLDHTSSLDGTRSTGI
jgi:hypothetical protein